MSKRSTLLTICLLTALVLLICLVATPTAAQDGPTPSQQTRAAERTQTPTPTPTRSGPFVATPDGPLIFDFPTPRAVGVQGPIAGQELSALEKSALAVVKLNGCSQAAATACTASDGSGIVIHPRGLILTALHVVIEDPDDLRSPLLPEVSVGIMEDPDEPVQSSYRATVAAIDSELDLALLRIIPPVGEPEPFFPTLPVETMSNRAFRTENLRVMGFPRGQTRLKQPSVDFYGLSDDAAVEVEGPLVGRGFSGGPLLVAGEDRYHVGGVVFFRTDGPVLVQPIHLLTNLRWRDPNAPRLWIENVQIEPTEIGGLAGLRLAANAHAVDLAERRLRLVATAFDPEQDQPWPSADEPLVLRRTFEPTRFVDVFPLDLEASLMGLGPLPERLRFALQLWDVDESRLLWDGEAYYLNIATVPAEPPTPKLSTPIARPSTIAPSIFDGSVPEKSEEGRFTLLGQAPVNSTLEILANEVPLGETIADAEGFWTFNVRLDEPGEYILSVRAIYSDTQVANADGPALVSVSSPTPTNTVTPTNSATRTATRTAVPTLSDLLAPQAVTLTPEERATSTPESDACVVQISGLNLRNGPGVAYAPPIDSLALDTVLLPLARDVNGSWIEVEVTSTGRNGWVSSASQYVDCNIDIAKLPIGIALPAPTPTLVPRPMPSPIRGGDGSAGK